MCLDDAREVIELDAHPRAVIRKALLATCERLKLGELHCEALICMAQNYREDHRCSPAVAVEYGFREAEKMERKLAARRVQMGLESA